ncbi:MAG: hypothetical protein ABWY56_11770 [Propionibacteriaceae bacterium]
MRTAAIAVMVLLSLASSSYGTALLLIAPAAAVSAIEITSVARHRAAPRVLALGWLVAAFTLVVVPSWVVTDLPVLLRTADLAAAVVVLSSVTTSIFVHPYWYDPDLHERTLWLALRRLAGPLAAAGSAAIAMTASWPFEMLPAVWAVALLPLISGARVWNLDHSLRHAVPLIREEGQRGRDQILREIHGALSTELRQLEQYSRDYREESPLLYEVAVNANSSLRETLTLADESRDTSTTTDTLMAPVLTLTRAEGASATAHIEVDELDTQDREIARYVLNEVTGEALRLGATLLDVRIAQRENQVVVEVTDNAPTGPGLTPGSTWSSSGPLAAKLAGHSGSLVRRPAREAGSFTTWAHWRARA